MTEQIDRMTTIIEFKRQLWPQPPRDASPSFYLINKLGFYKDGKKVWEQEIPEFDLYRVEKRIDYRGEEYFHLDDIGYYRMVEWDDNFGWLIKFRISHEDSKKVWDKILYLLIDELTIAHQYPSQILEESKP